MRTASRSQLRWAIATAILVLATTAPSAISADPTPTPGPSSTIAPGPQGEPPLSVESIGAPITLPHDGTIVVQTIRSIAALSIDDLALNQPTSQALINDAAHVATTVTIGPFTAGTSLVFSLHSSFTNQTYLSTGSHALVVADGPDKWAVGWEDWTDFNYSDVTMLVCYQGPTAGCPIDPERVLGRGSFGNTAPVQAYQSEPVNTAIGNYVTDAVDAHLPGRGQPFDFVRTYNSLATENGSLGPGWTHSFTARVVANADGSATVVSEDGARTTYAADGAGGFLRPPGAYGILTSVGGGYELLKRNQVRYVFDASGLLQSMADRNDNTISLGYTSGQLTTIADTVGRQVALTYNPDGTLAGLAFPPGRTVAYDYYPDGRLETVTDARGGVTTYTYDPAGRLETITDQNGHDLVTNIYGADGRVIEQVDARGFHTTFDWDPVTETSTMTDARGGEWVDDYDAGILMSQEDPLGNTTTFSFGAELGLSATVDPRGLRTETNVDTFGNMTFRKSSAPFNFTESWTYNGRNDPLTYVDRRGNTTRYTYDAAGNLKTVTGPAPVSPLTTYNYDPAGTGLLFSIVDPRGKTTTFGYDADANRDRVTTPLGNATTMTFDGAGRMSSVVDPRGNAPGGVPAQYTTTFTYDASDHVLTMASALDHTTTDVYDPVGNLLSTTDANDHATTFEYDDANHLTAVIDADQKRTEYVYDQVGNLTSRTDANLHVTSYAYDLAKRLTTEIRPLNRVWAYQYDPDGNLTKVIDPVSAATQTSTDYRSTFTYDALNRLSQDTPFGQTPTTFTYDPNSNRTQMTDAAGTSTYTYDVLNRLATYRRGGRGLDYQYDAASNPTRRTYTDGTVVDLTYDNDGRMATMVSAGLTTTYGYDPAANLLTTTLPAANGHVESRTYDRDGRLTEVKNQKGAAVLSRSTYTLDPVGNRLATETTTGTVTYEYDVVDRLTEACYTVACAAPGDNFRRYTYDPVGNRLTEVRDTGTTTYTYDAADQLTSTTGPGGAVTYTYDLDGRQTGAGSRTFTWAQPDRLASTRLGNTTTTYTYDGDGLRLQASTGNQANKKTQFDWDVNRPLPELVAERDGNGALTRRYRQGLATVSMDTGGSPFYFQYDGLGSVVNLTGSTGVVQWTYDYLPFGGVRTETKNQTQAPANVLRFTGQVLDPTGLYQLRARYFDPVTGRFGSTDPVVQPLEDPYVAAYVYARNDPVRLTDPSGRDTGGLCVTGEIAIGPFVFIEGSACIVASTSGQVGVALTGGGGGGVGLGASGGIGVTYSNGAEIYDLEGPFGVVGASGAYVVGLQGEGFAGLGHCSQPVIGGTGAVVVGGQASGQFGGTNTVVFGIGAPKSACPTPSDK